jgi:hypothetical protein
MKCNPPKPAYIVRILLRRGITAGESNIVPVGVDPLRVIPFVSATAFLTPGLLLISVRHLATLSRVCPAMQRQWPPSPSSIFTAVTCLVEQVIGFQLLNKSELYAWWPFNQPFKCRNYIYTVPAIKH